MYQIYVCNTLEAIRSKKSEWIKFENEAKHRNITSSFVWIENFIDVFYKREDNQFGYDKKIMVIFLYKNSKLVAIAPFMKVTRKKYGVKLSLIEFIGQQWAGTFIDIIGRDIKEQDLEQIFNYLYENEKFDLLQLSYIPQSTKNFNLNSENISVLSGCPYLSINKYDNFEEYRDKVYSKKLKQNIRTAFNKMGKQQLEYNSVIKKLSEEDFNDIIRISKTKLEDEKGCIYLDKDKRDFVKTISNCLNSEVVFCSINEKNVAYRLNFFFNNIKFCFDASYDREFRGLELGTISVEQSIRDSFNKGIKLHSEGTGTDFYKLKFMKDIEEIYTYTQKGNTLFSFIYYKRHLIRQKSKMN
ncbi:GNAT family N-acetyltransferase [Bacillus sp. FSL R9-9530]|uniref:GNAT family N-acetyltransferase n=1 Tax=Bacillus sp. FSL R9-9530 TaxID=2921593 RepID=UPI0030F8DC1D